VLGRGQGPAQEAVWWRDGVDCGAAEKRGRTRVERKGCRRTEKEDERQRR
jgi:hypothetical protein